MSRKSVGVRPDVGIIRQEGDRLGLRHAQPELDRTGDLLQFEDSPTPDLSHRAELAQDGDPNSVDGNSVHAGQDDAGLDFVPYIWPAAGVGLDAVEDEERTRREAGG